MKHLIRGRLKIESSMIFFGPFFLCSFTFFFPTACVGFGWRFLRSGSIKKKFSQKKIAEKMTKSLISPSTHWLLAAFFLFSTIPFFLFLHEGCRRLFVCVCVFFCVWLDFTGLYRPGRRPFTAAGAGAAQPPPPPPPPPRRAGCHRTASWKPAKQCRWFGAEEGASSKRLFPFLDLESILNSIVAEFSSVQCF